MRELIPELDHALITFADIRRSGTSQNFQQLTSPRLIGNSARQRCHRLANEAARSASADNGVDALCQRVDIGRVSQPAATVHLANLLFTLLRRGRIEPLFIGMVFGWRIYSSADASDLRTCIGSQFGHSEVSYLE